MKVELDLSNYTTKIDLKSARGVDTSNDFNDSLNTKISEVKKEIPNTTNLATTTVLTAVENIIPDHSKYLTTPEINKLTAQHFTVRLKQAKLAAEGDIADFVINQNIY